MAEDPIAEALRLLEAAADQELARHPRAHLLGARGAELELAVPVALRSGPQKAPPAQAAEALREELRALLDAKLAEQAALTPGRVIDLRTGESGGADCQPPDERSVFAGYAASGAPRFQDFGQWLLDRGHPEQHKLYRQPPGLVTEICTAEELMSQVLPALRPENALARVRGQVVAGWFRVPAPGGLPAATLALTLQVLSVRTRRGKKTQERWILDLLGVGPGGESLDEVVTRLDPVPWRGAVSWGQQALESFGRGKKQRGAELEKRILGVLGGVARRLHQVQRGRQRRTDHAEKRHQGGERPTRMAVVDLEKAAAGSFLVDRRHDTVIVLGDRGRAHVWSRVGKLVTSIRYTPDSIERKRNAEIWRPASADEASDLRQAVARRGR
ncbi:MAG: hypothetical protein AAF725_01515 [Acidobacteriota bacterium]